jgi:sarcosine oxidase subunit alpha
VLAAGAEWQIRPFGVLAQRLLRLEKGHIIVSQDTDFETLPSKVGMGWAVKMDKDDFIGKAALARLAPRTNRETLVPWAMASGTKAPPEGSTITIGGSLVGRVTSAGDSIALGHPIGLAWIATERAKDGAAVTIGDQEARIQIGHAFYDPEGAKLRA